ncbi:MAG: hypothetical protein OWT28_09725 [Firmicutes bacterium]|nr:hypothetical protein [Bacillota bacterium]
MFRSAFRIALTLVLLFVGFIVVSAVLSFLIKVAFLILLAAGVYFLLSRAVTSDRHRYDHWHK